MRRFALRQGGGRTGTISSPPGPAPLTTAGLRGGLVLREFLLDQGCVVSTRPLGVEPGVVVHGGGEIAVPEELPHGLVGPRISIEDHLGGQVPELVGCHLEAEVTPDRALNQPGDRGRQFWFAPTVIEQALG